MISKKAVSIVILVTAYMLSSTLSYLVFSQRKSSQKSSLEPASTIQVEGKDIRIVFNESLPKTEECLLNGALYPKPQREWWEEHRPLGIMIENHKDARPQSGISFADVVYEAVAEGGITRFLAIYHCQDAGIIGPIRSARTYFLDYVSEYGNDPLYVHVGGANTPGPADALSQIGDYGWTLYNDLNQFSIGFPTFWRDSDRLGHTVATEHTMYSTTSKLWEFAATRGLTNVGKDDTLWDKDFANYTFKDDKKALPSDPQTVHVEFWSKYPDYHVDWTYTSSTNYYVRKNKETAFIDKNNNKTLTAKNIVALFVQESRANDGYENNSHLLYKTKGTGNAAVFMDGERIDGTWRKDSRTSRTLLFDSSGKPIKFNRGAIWFSILPANGVISIR